MPSLTTDPILQGASNAAATINDNFDAIKAVVNGSLDNTNVKTLAGIAVTKLESGTDGQVVSTVSGAADWIGGLTKIDDKSPTAASADFTSIPGYFFGLFLVGFTRSAQAVATEHHRVRFNGDTATNYGHQQILLNNVTETSSQTNTVAGSRCCLAPGSSAAAGHFAAWWMEIPFYANTTNHKIFSSSGGTSSGGLASEQNLTRMGGLWASTAAITQVTISFESGANFASGSRVILYGIG